MAGLPVVPSMQAPCACGVIEYPVSNSGQTLVLSESVIEHLVRHRQIGRDSHEAGGQLFAHIEDSIIRIELATGPRPSDRRRPRSFLPNRLAERQEIQQLFKEGLHYVGDWHTHSERHPRPSPIDIASFQDMFCQSRHHLASFVLVVVGTAALPCGLFVGIANERSWRELSPSPLS